VFYSLLHNYRDRQLEDFRPDLVAHSTSDYHHLKPSIWKKRVSTCEFTQQRANGTRGSVSRFTVISNVAETESDTAHSYDPYRASLPPHPLQSQISHAKVTVHRHPAAKQESTIVRRYTQHYNAVSAQKRGPMPPVRPPVRPPVSNAMIIRPQSPRNVTSSVQSNRPITSYGRPATPRYKRTVHFSHTKKRSADQAQSNGVIQRGPSLSTASSKNALTRLPANTVSSRKPRTRSNASRPNLKIKQPEDPAAFLNEELRHFSDSIATYCDTAFNSSVIFEESLLQSPDTTPVGSRDTTPFSISLGAPSPLTPATPESARPWETRPLPPLPVEKRRGSEDPAPAKPTKNAHGSSETTQTRRGSKIFEQVNKLALPVLLPKHSERRATTSPITQPPERYSVPLPAITESGLLGNLSQIDLEKPRVASAPPSKSKGKHDDGCDYEGLDLLSRTAKTIRLVNSPASLSPVKVPLPLTIRKSPMNQVGTDGYGPIVQSREIKPPRHHALRPVSGMSQESNIDTAVKKKRSWFRRSSKVEESTGEVIEVDGSSPIKINSPVEARSDSVSTYAPPLAVTKKRFGFLFWRASRLESRVAEKGMMVSTWMVCPANIFLEIDFVNSSSPELECYPRDPPRSSSRNTDRTSMGRNIEVHQNWFARLFRVKPATSHLCFRMSRKRARQEVAILLKEWRQYGMTDVYVEKERNIIFARVGAENCKCNTIRPWLFSWLTTALTGIRSQY
jgi:serine/threonine-protein kinase HSL1, negative regulator of Swe1 kinase